MCVCVCGHARIKVVLMKVYTCISVLVENNLCTVAVDQSMGKWCDGCLQKNTKV